MKSLIRNGVLVKFDADDLNKDGHYECPKQVTRIADKAFYDCVLLVSINLPEVIEIKSWAFFGCTNLINVNFPRVNQVGQSAFEGCISLINSVLPQVTQIGRDAFRGCINLINCTLPKIAQIDSYAFYNCINLNTLVISSKVIFNANNALSSSHKLQWLIINDMNQVADINNIMKGFPNNGLPGNLNSGNNVNLLLKSKHKYYLWLTQQVLNQNLLPDVHQPILNYSHRLAFFKPSENSVASVGIKQEYNPRIQKTGVFK